MIKENWIWVERGVYPSGKRDKESIFFHRKLGKQPNGDDDIVLAGVVLIEHVAKVTKIQYSRTYVENPKAVPIDPLNFPVSSRIFDRPFSPDSKFDGIPIAFFDNNASGFWRKLARNSYVDEPTSAPCTPAQFLLESISGDGFWYFTPTRKLVRPIKRELIADAIEVEDNSLSVIEIVDTPKEVLRYI